MSDLMDPQVLKALSAQRRELVPETSAAFQAFQGKVFADGALDRKTKELIAVAAAHITQCHWCIQAHTRGALRAGATKEQLMEAVWVATEIRAGGAYMHSNIMLDTINAETAK